MANIKKIKEAVLANRGGLGEASDTQILTIWRSLDEATQNQYTESVKMEVKGNKNALNHTAQ